MSSATDTIPATTSEATTPAGPPLDSPSLYVHRELSLLQFNRRVLEQARDPATPLLERMRFLCISCSNLDEFFEVRVAGLIQQESFGSAQSGPDGLTPSEALAQISAQAHELVAEQYRVLNEDMLPALQDEGIRFLRRDEWSEGQAQWVRTYFEEEIVPIVSPIRLDPAHPFPRVLNKALNFIVLLRGEDAFGQSGGMAVVQAPRPLPRLTKLPAELSGDRHDFVFLSSVIHAHVAELFPGMEILGCFQFRVTRNSDLFVDTEEVDDLLRALEGELPGRRYGDEVRLEVADNCPDDVIDYLVKRFGLSDRDVYRVNGPVNLHRLMALPDLVDRPDLKYPGFTPAQPRGLPAGSDLFEAIAAGDILLHHPFQSFAPVADMVRQAAADPQVVAIKQTLYRTGSESVMVDSLLSAARAGKEVTVVVELRARFDEEANISLASRLQDAGAHVVYGVVGYKTHAKMLMIVRREGGKLRRYVHLGTGNYHARTARIYTDFGLLTADPQIGQDVHRIFMQLTSLGTAFKLKRLEAGAHHRQDECPHRAEGDSGALQGVAGGCRHRPRGPRRVRAAPRGGGGVRDHSRALDRGPLSRAQPHLLLRERRRPAGVLRQRGLDEPQPLPARRDLLPGARPGPARTRRCRRPRAVSGRQRPGVEHATRRQLRKDPPARRRAAGQRPGGASGAPRGPGHARGHAAAQAFPATRRQAPGVTARATPDQQKSSSNPAASR
jgi:polyphosphate kinase